MPLPINVDSVRRPKTSRVRSGVPLSGEEDLKERAEVWDGLLLVDTAGAV